MSFIIILTEDNFLDHYLICVKIVNMILNDNKILCRPKFQTLFRIVRCLDCTYPDIP